MNKMGKREEEEIVKILKDSLKNADHNKVTPLQCFDIINTSFRDLNVPKPKRQSFWSTTYGTYTMAVLVLLFATYASTIKYELEEGTFSIDGIKGYLNATYCIVDQSQAVIEITRPVADCSSMCAGMTEVPRLENLSKERFLEEFAYSGKPLLVTDATRNWTAIQTFNYTFFKNLYDGIEGSYQTNSQSCQFFPYKTRFTSLKHVFRMSKKRSKLLKDQWYIGWSNCDVEAMKKIREHYSKPYFLPDDAESSNIDWMFMGGTGEGADLHIDSVERPSWQAQITGRKTWVLVPPPECEHVCHTVNATMDTGDVVVVDTNTWYHSTYIHPGDMSITVGTEYD